MGEAIRTQQGDVLAIKQGGDAVLLKHHPDLNAGTTFWFSTPTPENSHPRQQTSGDSPASPPSNKAPHVKFIKLVGNSSEFLLSVVAFFS